MNLHEYQAKELLRKYHIPVPEFEAVSNADQAQATYDRMRFERCVVKAQVHAGGRGKAGGVRIVDSKQSLVEVVKSMIGTRLVTYQTTKEGQPVHKVLIEEPCQIERELYLSIVVDRAKQALVFMASEAGGMDIEAVAQSNPEKIHTFVMDPQFGVMGFQSRELAQHLNLSKKTLKSWHALLANLGRFFIENDLSLLEINPLVVNHLDELVCLDAKVTVDDNALHRQPTLRGMRDVTQDDQREIEAEKWELNYIALSGDIGCMVNGAGLAMATMDLIQLNGGQPANFLDVGGGATAERVAEAFKIILSDPLVKVVLVNIFGGIVRCDLIADGIISAVAQVGITVPVVVRLEGNNAKLGLSKLSESGLNIYAEATFEGAAKKSVELVKEQA
jgi:succinyl-CoA synthetase beta subunit